MKIVTLKGPHMAGKKATSAAEKGAQPGKAARSKTAAKGEAKVATKAPKPKTAAKVAAKAPAKVAAKAPVKAPAKAPVKAPPKVAAKGAAKTPAKATAKAPAPANTQAQRLRVTQNEKPWTAKEFAGIRAELEADTLRLQEEISTAEVDLAGLMRDVGDGAGDDPADAGTATFEREQEMSLANNARRSSNRAPGRLPGSRRGLMASASPAATRSARIACWPSRVRRYA